MPADGAYVLLRKNHSFYWLVEFGVSQGIIVSIVQQKGPALPPVLCDNSPDGKTGVHKDYLQVGVADNQHHDKAGD